MSTLNEKIFDAIEKNCVGYGSNPTIGKQDATDEIEKLILQEKIDLHFKMKVSYLLDSKKDFERKCDEIGEELTSQLKALP